MSLEERITAESLRLGFAAVGFAAAGPCVSLDAFGTWLASGRGAGLDYLRRNHELRADPRRLAPGAKSVIVAAARYPVNPTPGDGGFSCYARGRDYHSVLRDRLTALAAFIRVETGLSVARICVDSTPLAEREWALRAGVGWRGRQGQLVNAAFGCCFFVGELLVDAKLTPSEPAKNQCGDCQRCVEACPTRAIGDDGLVDARKCISYLTIEHRGEIPEAVRPLMDHSLFGCDRCTAVCPFNRPDDETIMPELQPQPMPSAEAILAMTEAEFKTRFRDSPVLRTGLERLQRNARIAIGNR